MEESEAWAALIVANVAFPYVGSQRKHIDKHHRLGIVVCFRVGLSEESQMTVPLLCWFLVPNASDILSIFKGHQLLLRRAVVVTAERPWDSVT